MIGIVLAAIVARAAGSMLYGLKPQDPITITLAAILLSAVALAASFVSARRAAGLEPMAALREE